MPDERGTDEADAGGAGPSKGLVARLKRLAGKLLEGERSMLTRLAGAAFLVRVASAALAFVAQVLLARWMGAYDFGIYVYVWTWAVMLGLMAPLGLGSAAQRFLPEYTEKGDAARLGGFLRGARWLAFGLGAAIALAGLLVVWAVSGRIAPYYVVPLAIAFACLPFYALSEVQDGIARSYDWVGLALAPFYIACPILILAAIGTLHALGAEVNATRAILAATLATILAAIGQGVVLDRRLARREDLPGAALKARPRHERRAWMRVALPIFMIESFYLLLTYTDILVLEIFVPPDQVAVYYAATKTLAPVAFVYFSVAAAVTHKFTAFHVAGERDKLARFLADTIHWTFWPSLAAAIGLLALGKPILSLFGPGFEAGYPLMFVLAAGLLARALVGPVERLLVMLGEEKACAAVYAVAFLVNLGLCFLLIPRFGLMGAAVAPTIAYMLESVLLVVVARRRLGFNAFVLGRPA
ncbi:lipopolysaccharide biosynthesis protein [Ancylobacter terrae]|uniref:lipopolysaccharide biosynthesis protein n=1 Tax=Ancylobacter sp. sgz301288 TaxID=3342077 RepID=UPI003859159A